MTEFPPEWLELFDSLRSNRVRYLIVGGHAVAANASPRRTDDIDIFVEPTVENARRLGEALREYGYPALATAWRKFTQRDRMATIGIEPLRIDIMTSISGVDFDDAWASRIERTKAGRTLPFLGLEALLVNKRAAARLKDLADVAKLTGESEEELIRDAAARLAARREHAAKPLQSPAKKQRAPARSAEKDATKKRPKRKRPSTRIAAKPAKKTPPRKRPR